MGYLPILTRHVAKYVLLALSKKHFFIKVLQAKVKTVNILNCPVECPSYPFIDVNTLVELPYIALLNPDIIISADN